MRQEVTVIFKMTVTYVVTRRGLYRGHVTLLYSPDSMFQISEVLKTSEIFY
jgi:hypothetical protein